MASLSAVARLRLPPPSHHHKIPSRRLSQNRHHQQQKEVFYPLLATFDSPQSVIFPRSKCVMGLQRRRRNGSAVVWASPSSNSDPAPTTKDVNEESGGQGPPLLTILAGFLVFLGFCWVVVTIGTWLFNLIAFPPPPK
ncbi:unnamed protein product [Linum trigynum]|uniref:Uncharacterized protein n=1 Tax=Linum trigynum TaxID=586398 RepID=A0AAV2DVI8_9ROSI